MTKYKMIALDMDGTLLNEQSEISAENERWIHEALNAGVIVSFCTGRGKQGVTEYVKQLELTTPLVLVNGSEVWMEPEKLHTRHLMDVAYVEALRELALHYDTWYWAYSVNGIYNRERWTEDAAVEQWLKFGFYMEDAHILQQIRKEIPKVGRFEVTNSHPFNLELNPNGVNKASGIREVCEHYGFTMDEVVAVGDSLNDLAMIREAGLGIAMANAQPVVKEAADEVTLTNDEDGVADVIRRKVLNNE